MLGLSVTCWKVTMAQRWQHTWQKQEMINVVITCFLGLSHDMNITMPSWANWFKDKAKPITKTDGFHEKQLTVWQHAKQNQLLQIYLIKMTSKASLYSHVCLACLFWDAGCSSSLSSQKCNQSHAWMQIARLQYFMTHMVGGWILNIQASCWALGQHWRLYSAGIGWSSIQLLRQNDNESNKMCFQWELSPWMRQKATLKAKNSSL